MPIMMAMKSIIWKLSVGFVFFLRTHTVVYTCTFTRLLPLDAVVAVSDGTSWTILMSRFVCVNRANILLCSCIFGC